VTHKMSAGTPRTGRELLLIAAKKQQSLLLKREKTLKRQVEEHINAGSELCSLAIERSELINAENDMKALIKQLDALSVRHDRLMKIIKSDFLKLNNKAAIAQAERESFDFEIKHMIWHL